MSSKTTIEEFDIVILGGGTGGTVAAWTFAGEGRRVAVIERKYVGGSCPNIACLPSKNVIHSAKVASLFTRGREFGIVGASGEFEIDMRAVRERKRKMVSSWNNIYLETYESTGAKLIFGNGRFIGPKTIEVELPDGTTRQLRGTNVIVNTGTRAAFEPIPGLADAQPLTHIEALELDEVPSHLIVLGSGYIGLEFAQAMRRFGSEVTIIDRNARLATAPLIPTEPTFANQRCASSPAQVRYRTRPASIARVSPVSATRTASSNFVGIPYVRPKSMPVPSGIVAT